MALGSYLEVYMSIVYILVICVDVVNSTSQVPDSSAPASMHLRGSATHLQAMGSVFSANSLDLPMFWILCNSNNCLLSLQKGSDPAASLRLDPKVSTSDKIALNWCFTRRFLAFRSKCHIYKMTSFHAHQKHPLL